MTTHKARRGRRIRVIGALAVGAGLLFNKWLLAYLFSPDNHIEVRAYVLVIYAVQLLLLGLGTLLLLSPQFFDTIIGWLWRSSPNDGGKALSAALACAALVFLLLCLAPTGAIQLAVAAAYQYPLLLLSLMFVLIAACVRLLRAGFVGDFGLSRRLHWKALLSYIAIAYVVVYIGWALAYAFSPVYFGHLEPHVASVAAAFTHGQPVYHNFDSGWRYSMLYGPVTYLVPALLFRIAGPSIFTAKLGGTLSGLGGLTVVYCAYRAVGGRRNAGVWIGCLAALLLLFGRYSFWSRADSYLFFCSAAAVSALLLRSWVWASVICGAMLGLAIGFKAHGALYVAPVVAVLIQRRGWRTVAVSGTVAALFGSLPFLVQGVSLAGMVSWLRAASGHGMELSTFLPSLQWVVFLAAPLLAAACMWALLQEARWTDYARRNGLVVCTAVLSVLGVAVVASKVGAGPHHFLPFLPLGLSLVACHWRLTADDLRRSADYLGPVLPVLAAAFGLSVFALSSSLMRLDVHYFLRHQLVARAVVDDIQDISIAYPNARIAMGVGSGDQRYERTYYRPVLVFRGNPYVLDAAALMDMQVSGIAMPDAALEQLRSGEADIWLIPRGTDPFTLDNFYTRAPLFGDVFRQCFHESYRLREQSRFFDLWFFANGTQPDLREADAQVSREAALGTGCPVGPVGSGVPADDRTVDAALSYWRLWLSG